MHSLLLCMQYRYGAIVRSSAASATGLKNSAPARQNARRPPITGAVTLESFIQTGEPYGHLVSHQASPRPNHEGVAGEIGTQNRRIESWQRW
jgi:hypothetical protein